MPFDLLWRSGSFRTPASLLRLPPAGCSMRARLRHKEGEALVTSRVGPNSFRFSRPANNAGG
jgi:hypothetical protein